MHLFRFNWLSGWTGPGPMQRSLSGLFESGLKGPVLLFALVLGIAFAQPAAAQTGNAGSIHGQVLDPSGAALVGATVEIQNPVSGYVRSASTDSQGNFEFDNIPLNPYHLSVTAPRFQSAAQDVDVRSAVPVEVKMSLKIGAEATQVSVTAEAGDLVEQTSVNHTDVDRALFDKVPLESASSGISSLVTLTTPGIAADSNGLFHGMGDHNEVSFHVDGQPITDQQSKLFSNQIPLDSVQSLEVIPGAPPAEFGDKTSVVIEATTRSGQGMTPPHGSVTASYGTFGTALTGFQFGWGGPKWGNYFAVNGLNTSRFLDPPEFTALHDKGNEENVFDRVDYQLSTANSVHINLGYTRSWFQNPNTDDQQLHPGLFNNVTGGLLGPADQRSQIKTINIAPSWTRLISSSTVFTLGGFLRRDDYNYYPSRDPFADYAPDLQVETANQDRKLTNMGLRSEVSYVKGVNNLKAGVTFQHTFITENDGLGIVDPTFNPACFNSDGSPNTNPAVTSTGQCGGPLDVGGAANPSFNPLVACIDFTRPTPNSSDGCSNSASTPFIFHGHSDIKEVAAYVQDEITKGSWSFNLGLRGDLYRGISRAQQLEPRLGIAYNIKPSSTVLRISYARVLETPFNENLVIASTGCSIPVIAAIVPPAGVPCVAGPVTPGYRNEFHAGLQQAFGKHVVVDGEYVWKYTHNAYDFGVVGATPIAFPIEWTRSKIPGFDGRISVPNYHGLSAFVVMSSVAARFFLPQVAGIPIIGPAPGVFRIDHDEHFNQTTHFQYQLKQGPWIGFNWRYDSGLVAGATPCYNPLTATCAGSSTTLNGMPAVKLINTISGLPLTADQEFQGGFTCNGVSATPFQGLPSPCLASQLGSTFLKIPAPGTENDDHNPQRTQPRHLFDLAVGDDNLFHGDKYKWSLTLTAVNVADKVTIYNFLSTFSGTHYVTPRALTAELGFHF
jgi:hypothetical protein